MWMKGSGGMTIYDIKTLYHKVKTRRSQGLGSIPTVTLCSETEVQGSCLNCSPNKIESTNSRCELERPVFILTKYKTVRNTYTWDWHRGPDTLRGDIVKCLTYSHPLIGKGHSCYRLSSQCIITGNVRVDYVGDG